MSELSDPGCTFSFKPQAIYQVLYRLPISNIDSLCLGENISTTERMYTGFTFFLVLIRMYQV